jgi:alpha-1,2-mannosyltransferase
VPRILDVSTWRRRIAAMSGRTWGVVAIVVGVLVTAYHVLRGNRHAFADLAVYRNAVIWWADGHPLYTYAQPDATQGTLGFTYPPFAALLMTPLRWLAWPYLTQILYGVAAFALLAFIVRLLTSPVAAALGWQPWGLFAVVLPLSTLLEPVRETITFGQINLILTALVLADFLILRGRSRAFGALTGLATAIKLVPGIFIVYLLACRRWTAAAVAGTSFLAATGLAWLASPSDSWTYWSRVIFTGEGVGRIAYAFNQSIAGMLARLWSPASAPRWLWLGLAVACVVVGLVRAASIARAGDEVAAVTIVGIAGSLASPISWVHHLIWFLPAILILIREGMKRESGGWLALAATIFATVSYSLVAIYDETVPRLTGALAIVTGNWDTYLLLVLLVVLPWSRDVPHGAEAPRLRVP